MLFNSFEFVLGYLPLVFVVFFLVGRFSAFWAAAWLGVASVAFYGWWDVRYLPLLLGSILFNYLIGGAIAANAGSPRAKAVLIAGIAVDLLVLAYYKYAGFFLSSLDAAAGLDLPILRVVLPLGISFFTFTQIAFLVDVHRGIATERRLVHYALFVTYFPHLIAGPVIHHKQVMPQFADARTYRLNWDNVAAGAVIFGMGMAKKVLLADTFADWGSPVFAAAQAGQPLDLATAWTGAIAYTLQIYFDFSGYSDMAVGISRMFGVQLPWNFNSPYRSRDIIEFWRRWHITLSTFLRDYLYIPLGGNRKGPARRYVNLFATMVLGGLWHGASWTFVVWGALHGLYLAVNHGYNTLMARAGRTSGDAWPARLASGLLTFVAVVAAWVFFRAESFPAAFAMLKAMAGFSGLPENAGAFMAGLSGMLGYDEHLSRLAGGLALGLFICWALPNSTTLVGCSEGAIHRFRFAALSATGVVILLLLMVNGSRGASEFIYFNF